MLSVGPLHGPLHLQQVFKLCVDHRWPTFNIQIPEKAESTLEVNWGRGSQPQGISCFSMGHSLTQSQGEREPNVAASLGKCLFPLDCEEREREA